MQEKRYFVGFGGGYYTTMPDADYTAKTIEELFDKMQAGGVSADRVVNLGAYEAEGVFWDKSKREALNA